MFDWRLDSFSVDWKINGIHWAQSVSLKVYRAFYLSRYFAGCLRKHSESKEIIDSMNCLLHFIAPHYRFFCFFLFLLWIETMTNRKFTLHVIRSNVDVIRYVTRDVRNKLDLIRNVLNELPESV